MFCSLLVGGKALFDPATLSLTGWWRNYAGSPPLSGTASAGTSGSNGLSHVTTDPTAGTALNGQGTMSCNGTTSALSAAGTLATYVAATTCSGWALINPANVTADHQFWDDSNDVLRLGVGTVSGNASLRNSAGVTVSRAITVSTWSLVTFRRTGSNIQIGVNEAPGAAGGGSTAADALTATITGTVRIGSNALASSFYSGLIADFGITSSSLVDADFTNIKSYINGRYALSL